MDFWKSVIFADETTINLFGTDGKITELKDKNIKNETWHEVV